MHCETWAEYRVAQERVTQHFVLGGSPVVVGEDKAVWSPWITLRDRAADRAEKGVAHFGLSLMARTRIRIQPQSDLFANDFETFLSSLAWEVNLG